MMRANLFFVESPFQVISANEAKNHYNIFNGILIVRLSAEPKNNEQIRDMVLLSDWEYVFYIKHLKFSIIHRLITLLHLLYVRLRFRKFDKVFISYLNQSLQTKFLKYIKFNELFLIDDGTMTISYYNQINRGLNGVFESLVRHNKNPKITFFTFFDLPKRIDLEIQKNDFNYLKSLFTDKKSIKKNTAWFIGGNWVEFGAIDKETYHETIKSEVQKFTRNHSIHYLAHRREQDENLRDLQAIENLTIVQNIEPLELKLLKSNELPTVLIAFISTSVFMLRLLFPESKIVLLDHNIMNLDSETKMRCDEYKGHWENLN